MTNETENTATLMHEGVTYRKVNRKANVGEKVLITESEVDGYEMGDIYDVIKSHNIAVGFFDQDGDINHAEHREYAVLEPIAESPSDLALTEADIRNNPRQVIDLLANMALRLTKAEETIESITRDVGWHEMGPGRIANMRNSIAELKHDVLAIEGRIDDGVDHAYEIDDKVDRLASANEQAISTVADQVTIVTRNVETWAQETERIKHVMESPAPWADESFVIELSKKVSKIDAKLSAVDERTQPYQVAHDIFVKIAGGMNGRDLTAEERREL